MCLKSAANNGHLCLINALITQVIVACWYRTDQCTMLRMEFCWWFTFFSENRLWLFVEAKELWWSYVWIRAWVMFCALGNNVLMIIYSTYNINLLPSMSVLTNSGSDSVTVSGDPAPSASFEATPSFFASRFWRTKNKSTIVHCYFMTHIRTYKRHSKKSIFLFSSVKKNISSVNGASATSSS